MFLKISFLSSESQIFSFISTHTHTSFFKFFYRVDNICRVHLKEKYTNVSQINELSEPEDVLLSGRNVTYIMIFLHEEIIIFSIVLNFLTY